MPIETEGQYKARAEDEQIDNFEAQIEEMEAENELDYAENEDVKATTNSGFFGKRDAFGGIAG